MIKQHAKNDSRVVWREEHPTARYQRFLAMACLWTSTRRRHIVSDHINGSGTGSDGAARITATSRFGYLRRYPLHVAALGEDVMTFILMLNVFPAAMYSIDPDGRSPRGAVLHGTTTPMTRSKSSHKTQLTPPPPPPPTDLCSSSESSRTTIFALLIDIDFQPWRQAETDCLFGLCHRHYIDTMQLFFSTSTCVVSSIGNLVGRLLVESVTVDWVEGVRWLVSLDPYLDVSYALTAALKTKNVALAHELLLFHPEALIGVDESEPPPATTRREKREQRLSHYEYDRSRLFYFTPLYYVIEKGRLDMLKTILLFDPEMLSFRPYQWVNHSGHSCESPLHLAMIRKYLDVFDFLLKQFPFMVTVRNEDDGLPLHLAIRLGHVGMVQRLLSLYPAALLVMDEKQRTPMALAGQWAHDADEGRKNIFMWIMDATKQERKRQERREESLKNSITVERVTTTPMMVPTMVRQETGGTGGGGLNAVDPAVEKDSGKKGGVAPPPSPEAGGVASPPLSPMPQAGRKPLWVIRARPWGERTTKSMYASVLRKAVPNDSSVK